MERRMRFIWWGVLVILIIVAIWKLFLPHGSKAYIEKSAVNREITVYITGAVEKPGLIKLAVDSRIDDALKQGHPLPEANLAGINPAEKLKDGQKIVVPYKEQTQDGLTAQDSGKALNETNQSNMISYSIISGSSNNSGKININTAGVAELDKLPGVGPAIAERIIQYRTENGPFAQPEDLQNVSGIGPKKYQMMSSLVTVQP